jgi:hypothetical protein
MSRWQKIGVLASFLWLIGLPIYLMTDSNRRASEFYNWCRKVESNLAFEMTAEQQHDTCWRSAKFMTPTVLAQTLIAGNADTVTLRSARDLLGHLGHHAWNGAVETTRLLRGQSPDEIAKWSSTLHSLRCSKSEPKFRPRIKPLA